MEMRSLLLLVVVAVSILLPSCTSSIQRRQISPGFQATQMDWIDNNGIFLLSPTSTFGFGFSPSSPSSSSFLLVVLHLPTSTVLWTANPSSPVSPSDNFIFSSSGDASLSSSSWSTATSNKSAASMSLTDSGNLIILSSNPPTPLWQSFSHPTDTLLSNQIFTDGMELLSKSNPSRNITYRLKFTSGDLTLSADFRPPQPYWSMSRENRKIINKAGGAVRSAVLISNSWNFYDDKQALIWQFVVGAAAPNTTQAIVLGSNGFISFVTLPIGGSESPSPTAIPQDSCGAPESCDPYYICYSGSRCQCPKVLNSASNCDPGVANSACSSNGSVQLAEVDDGVGYVATSFVSPVAVSNLSRCKSECLRNCTCVALFHEESSGKCFLFDRIGSLQQLSNGSKNYAGFIKISGKGDPNAGGDGDGGGGEKHLTVIVVVCVVTAGLMAALIYLALRIRLRKRSPEPSQVSSDEDDFLEAMSSMPVRYSYAELQEATENFTVKLGQGGFGSVYLGKLPDGTQIAVKKLEGIGQGKKEFRSEVTIIGSIHHVHLVRLRGFCAEGAHRLLAYEFMANGSLDKWIFRDSRDGFLLDWDKRYNIALGTAKGLAYLHEDCTSKIIHCDIKPENVLLDYNFHAKVSDFGLAKLMTREQSHVFTTMRGTRGYLAPEWITSYEISEKSDVYSFGMVLLEIIGGRKNYDPAESSEKAHFPSYAFKKMEEGKLKEVFDVRLKYDDKDGRVDTAIKIALLCIQEDQSLRPSMTKVVQMLEGLSYVPQPPASYQMGFRLFANMYKSSSEGTTSGPSDCSSEAFLSDVRLSGPR